MRRTFLIGLVALSGTVGLVAYGGCSDEPPVEDLCGWLNDPNSCYRNFTKNIEQGPGVARCADLSKGGKMLPPGGQLGAFTTRTMPMGECFIQTGGIIAIDPPIDLSKLPLPDEKITLTNADATTCGLIDFTASNNFSITVAGDMIPDGGTPMSGQVSAATFKWVPTPMRATVTATCGVDSHYFNTLQVGKCPALQSGMPNAELDLVTGGLDQTGNAAMGGQFGALKLKVFLPPTTPGADGSFNNQNGTEVDYFTCLIPPPPPRCANGIQDGGETDVDCGGQTGCPPCPDTKKCISDSDCISTHCQVSQGLSTCAPAAGTSSSGSTTGTATSTTTGATTSSGTTSSTSAGSSTATTGTGG